MRFSSPEASWKFLCPAVDEAATCPEADKEGDVPSSGPKQQVSILEIPFPSSHALLALG